jgi:hypothetical protein
MPKDPTQDPKFSVGNASRNLAGDVLYIKSLLFTASAGSPTALTAEERSAISETSEACEPALVKALARIQNANVPSEKASGGRVVAWSKTLALLKKHGRVGLYAETVDAAQEALVDLARQSAVVLDKARAESYGGVQLKKIANVSGTAGTGVSGTANVGAGGGTTVLDVDLSKWVQEIQALKTSYKVTGGIGGQAGAGKWGGGAGTVEITDTETQETKTYGLYFGSSGASVSKVSFSVSTPLHESGAVMHIYRGPLRKKTVDFDSFGGTFVALSGGLAAGYGAASGSVTIYFFGFSILDFRPGMNPGWELLQKCAGITMVWGTSSGMADVKEDAGVQFQTGKLLGKWTDIVRN